MLRDSYNEIISLARETLEEEYSEGRINGENYARMLGMFIEGALHLAISKPMREKELELMVEKLALEKEQKALKIANLQKQLEFLQEQIAKLKADTILSIKQGKAVEQQVIDNRKIRIFDGLGNTYGALGAGGLLIHKDMWGAYFNLARELSGLTVPKDVTVKKS